MSIEESSIDFASVVVRPKLGPVEKPQLEAFVVLRALRCANSENVLGFVRVYGRSCYAYPLESNNRGIPRSKYCCR